MVNFEGIRTPQKNPINSMSDCKNLQNGRILEEKYERMYIHTNSSTFYLLSSYSEIL